MTEGVQNLINAIAEGDSIAIESAFNQEMATRISDRLDDMRIEVAQSMFATEEVDLDEEELDELSKATTQSYLDKATKDHSKSMGAYDKAKTSNTREKHNTNIVKRSKGIASAMKRKAADELNKTGSYFEPKHIRGSNQEVQNIAKNRKNVKEETTEE